MMQWMTSHIYKEPQDLLHAQSVNSLMEEDKKSYIGHKSDKDCSEQLSAIDMKIMGHISKLILLLLHVQYLAIWK